MSFEKYLEKVKNNSNQAIKVEWLNYDESVNFEFTNSLYDIDVVLNVNYQNGSRRTCTLTLNNDKNQFPINFNNIWIGQKFKLWMGVYLDDGTPYYYPQGVFYVSNPEEVYNPTTKTVKINGVDKWAYLDGTLHGYLSGTYQTNINTNLFSATKSLLFLPQVPISELEYKPLVDLEEYFATKHDSTYYFEYKNQRLNSNNSGVKNSEAKTTLYVKKHIELSFKYAHTNDGATANVFNMWVNGVNTVSSGKNEEKNYSGRFYPGDVITFNNKIGSSSHTISSTIISDIKVAYIDKVVDPTPPKLSPYFVNKTTVVPTWSESKGEYENITQQVLCCPYTATVERGGTYADILLEYATILCAHIYYDVNGRLTIEPMSDEVDNIVDTNKEVVWDYSVEEKTFLGLTQTYNFNKVYNDIIVLGNIVNGKQFKARVQNRNTASDTCIQKIGLKTKEPFEDNQYYSDEQCRGLAIYYAKVDTILQKSGDINSLPLYHIDVNKLVTVSTPNNNMGRELFLITGFTINSLKTMSINITSVNDLKNFSVVEG